MNSTAETRLHYFDNLRALAMILGVFFHAALAYSNITHNLWPAADSQQSALVDPIIWFTHLFRMPLFFLIAGFFVAYMVTRRGIRGMLANRTKRLLIPFIIFLPLCTLAVIAGILWAARNIQNKSPVLEMVAHALANPGTQPPPPSTMHLWFLYYLVLFCVFVWIFSYMNFNPLKNLINRLHPLVIMVAVPLVLTLALFNLPAPFPAPESFLPQLWAFGFFGLFFAAGYFIFHNENFLDNCKPWWPWLLVLSLLVYSIYFSRLPDALSLTTDSRPASEKLIMALLQGSIAWWMTLVCLIAGKYWLNFRNGLLRFLSESSYWTYIAHLPVLFMVQYLLMDVELSLATKYVISVLGTLLVCIASYLMFVRWTPIGWLLNGRKQHQVKASSTTQPEMPA